MSTGWVVFWIVEVAIAAGVFFTYRGYRKPTSMDVKMGDDIAMMLLLGAGVLIGIVGAIVFLWHHLRYA